MGLGDVKMLGMIGALLGPAGVLVTVLAASLSGSVVGIALMIARGADGKMRLPFGVFLALGAIGAWFFARPADRPIPGAMAVATARRAGRRGPALLPPGVAALPLDRAAPDPVPEPSHAAVLPRRRRLGRSRRPSAVRARSCGASRSRADAATPATRRWSGRALEPDVVVRRALRRATAGGCGRSGPGPVEAPVAPRPRGPRRAGSSTPGRSKPPLIISTFATGKRFFVLALDPGAGGRAARLRPAPVGLHPGRGRRRSRSSPRCTCARSSQPYDRLLARGRRRARLRCASPATSASSSSRGSRPRSRRSHEKERELERLARREKERADDLETAARTLSKNLPTGLLSVDPDGRVVELNEAGREILKLDREIRGEPYGRVLADAPEFRDARRAGPPRAGTVGGPPRGALASRRRRASGCSA